RPRPARPRPARPRVRPDRDDGLTDRASRPPGSPRSGDATVPRLIARPADASTGRALRSCWTALLSTSPGGNVMTRVESTRARGTTRLVTALATITLLQWLAASSTLPLLPVWLGRRGASDLVIGLAMGAFFVGALAAQYPLGRRIDRSAPGRLLLV